MSVPCMVSLSCLTQRLSQASIKGIPLVGGCVAPYQTIWVSRESISRGKPSGAHTSPEPRHMTLPRNALPWC